MTKGELIKRMAGLPDDTEIVWEDFSDGAGWTFLEIGAEVELLARVEFLKGSSAEGKRYWERLSVLRHYDPKALVRMVRMQPVVVLGET